MVARCDDPTSPATSSLRTRIQPILFVLVLFVLLFCSPIVALSTRLSSAFVFFFPCFVVFACFPRFPFSFTFFPPWNRGYSTVCARFVDHMVNPPLGRLFFFKSCFNLRLSRERC